VSLISRAWMLDPVEFHREFAELYGARSSPEGFVRLRARAARIWRSADPIVQGYVELLRTATPDEWDAGFEETHVVDWYRVLMAPYLTPTRAFRSPDLLKRRLPDLGWSPSEARRLALGRELQLLAEAYAPPEIAGPLGLQLTLGNKGWLSQDDVAGALERMRRLDRHVFRDHQDLVPVVEHAYEVLEAAATKPDQVLVMISD
jgi:hypothetical protein